MKILLTAIAAGSVVFLLAGCDKIGQTPAGGSDAEVKAAFDKQPLDVRAKELMGSPAPYEVKMQKIKDMYAKEGKTPPADLVGGGGGGQGGAPPENRRLDFTTRYCDRYANSGRRLNS